MHLSVDELRRLGRCETRMLLYARNCTCRESQCDVCGVRCPISLADGGDIAYPVRCNNGHVYDVMLLKDWVERHPLASTVEVIPDVTIASVETVRAPFANAARVAFGLLRRAPRTQETACQTDSTHSVEAALSPPSPPTRPVTLPAARRLPLHHAFPRAVVRNSPLAVCAFAWPRERRESHDTLHV